MPYFQSPYPKAVYVYSMVHTLNHVMYSMQKNKQNMMGTMVEICLFFVNSHKHQSELEKYIKNINNTATRLSSMCKTKWDVWINAPESHFYDIFSAVVCTQEVIIEGTGWNAESDRPAGGLSNCITQFHLFSFTVSNNGLEYTKGCTVTLEKNLRIFTKTMLKQIQFKLLLVSQKMREKVISIL